jgi:hypothetical protein
MPRHCWAMQGRESSKSDGEREHGRDDALSPWMSQRGAAVQAWPVLQRATPRDYMVEGNIRWSSPDSPTYLLTSNN